MADVNSEDVGESVVLFPNPARNRVVITCSAPQWDVALHDYLGRELMRSIRRDAAFAIDQSSLDDGIYFVMVDTYKRRTSTLLVVE